MTEVLESAPHRPSERLLTVGIPVFNGRSLFRNCLQSVVDSTLDRARFEIVVVDDGSSEPETHAILTEFTERLAADPGFFRVVTLRKNSGGAARPRNRVLDEAVGEHVFFVDSDDTIGSSALERIADALDVVPADWVALNQVPVNGRSAVCRVRQAQVVVPRDRALTTLTVHKVFRRAEIERQRLRFDEGLPSGQDVAFAFSYILGATNFLMLGDYEFYYLTQHVDDPSEPVHLSRRARTPKARIEKNERILRSMVTALRGSGLPESEQREILAKIALPRILIQEGYLVALAKVGPNAGTPALRRLSKLLADPLVVDLDPAGHKGLTAAHLAAVARSDWAGLARLVDPSGPQQGLAARRTVQLVARARRLLDVASGRERHGRLVNELTLIRRSVEDVRKAQRQIEATLLARLPVEDATTDEPRAVRSDATTSG